VNDLVKFVKKKEARHQGAVSQTRRSIKEGEYNRVLELLKEKPNIICRYGIPALMNFQFHLIAQIDCSMPVTIVNLKPHHQFNFCLKTRLNQSKNVTKERDGPLAGCNSIHESSEMCFSVNNPLAQNIYGFSSN
jgi:hypothetical protein